MTRIDDLLSIDGVVAAGEFTADGGAGNGGGEGAAGDGSAGPRVLNGSGVCP